MKTKQLLAAVACVSAATLSGAAWAGAGVGAGVTWTFGGPKAMSGAALGVKVFSTDREDKAAASLGLDYSFANRSIRPNVGVAYLGKNNIYLDANVGYSFAQQGLDFGVGTGYVDTKDRR